MDELLYKINGVNMLDVIEEEMIQLALNQMMGEMPESTIYYV